MTVAYRITQRGREFCEETAMWEGVTPESREILNMALDKLFPQQEEAKKEEVKKQSRFENIIE